MGVTGEGTVLGVSHITRYAYARSVDYSVHKAYLTPRATSFQELLSTRVTMDPPAHSEIARTDYFGNESTYFTIDTPHTELRIEVQSELRVQVATTEPGADYVGILDLVRESMTGGDSQEALAASEFLYDSPHAWQSPEFAEFAGPCFGGNPSFLTGVGQLMQRIHSEFRYDPTVTTVTTPVSEVLAHQAGVCQDFAHLMISCLRTLGVPARYVSGYLVPGPDVVGAQASHAWVSAYCPGYGWVDFDPTNNVIPSGHHITLAWGRDFSDVSPFRGVVVGGGDHEISVGVVVSNG